MHFLVDSCISLLVCKMLKECGYSYSWVPDIFKGDPGDEVIIDKAIDEESILITADKDFGELIFLKGKKQPPLIRLAAMSPGNQAEIIKIIIDKHAKSLQSGALITATKEKIRIRL